MGGLAFLQNLLQQPQQMPMVADPGPEPSPVSLPLSPQQQAMVPQQAPNDPSLNTLSWLGQNAPQSKAAPVQGPTKLHKLLGILYGGAMGAAAGAGQRTFGQGFEQAGNLAFLGQQRKAQLAQEQAQTQGIQQETAQRAAQTKMLQTSVPVTLPNGQQVMIPQSALGAYLGKVAPADIKAKSAENVQEQKSKTAENVANINKRYMAVPNVGLYDTQSKQLVPETQNGINITPEIAADYDLPQQFIGKPMNVQQLSQLERAQNQQTTTVQGANGPALVNKKTAKTTPLGLGAPAMGRPMEIADPNNPGQTLITTGAAAQGQAGKGSASLSVAKKAASSEVPTNIGNQKVAFNTMISHAELLRQAAQAVNNGDIRTLNSINNRLKTEFGDADYTNLGAIANAYNHEVTQVISKGHITDSEVGKGERTLPLDANMDTINKVLNSYQQLAQKKMDMLDQQKQNAIKLAQPKGKGSQAPAQGITVTDPRGVVHSFPNQAAANSFKAAAGIQ